MASQEARASAPGPESQQATLKSAAVHISAEPYDFQTEQQLLVFANQSRQHAGAPPLKLDAGLSQAARNHAEAMLKAQRLSHQLDGEPSLPQRLAATTQLQLAEEAENVALDYDAQNGHEHLMLSAPHRANLLNPAYNVVGLGVVRSGEQIYIVQDFGNALLKYSPAEVKEHVAAAVNQARLQANRPALQDRNWLAADDAACSMAHADKIEIAADRKPAESGTVLTYTSLRPETLPGEAAHVIDGRNLRSFSVGACYGRTTTYPAGVYWVVLLLQ